MSGFDLGSIKSPEMRREIEGRLDLWRRFLGSGPPDALRAKAKAAGYRVPRPREFDIRINDFSGFDAATDIDGGPYFEFTLGVSFAARALCAALIASGDLLVGFQHGALEPARPPFPRKSDWRAARGLVLDFSEERFLAWRQGLIRTGIVGQPGRAHLLNTLSMQIETFIILHELGHHRMAHLEFLGRHQDEPVSPFLRQVFELEADRNAISTMFNNFYASFELVDDAEVTEEMRALRAMPAASRWRLWTVMVGLLFLTLEIWSPGARLPGERRLPPWAYREAGTYLPPMYRLKHAVIWARDLVKPQDPGALASYRDAVGCALADIRRMAGRLGVSRPLGYFRMDTSAYEVKLAAARAGFADELNAMLEGIDRNEYED